MNNSELAAFSMGLFIGGIIVIGLVVFTNTLHNRATKAITQCEKELPRNQHCVITAIPEVIK